MTTMQYNLIASFCPYINKHNGNKCAYTAHIASGDLNPYHILIHMSLKTALCYSYYYSRLYSKETQVKPNVTHVVMIGNRCFPRQFSALSMISNCF